MPPAAPVQALPQSPPRVRVAIGSAGGRPGPSRGQLNPLCNLKTLHTSHLSGLLMHAIGVGSELYAGVHCLKVLTSTSSGELPYTSRLARNLTSSLSA